MPAWILRAHNIKDEQLDLKTNTKINFGTIVVKSLWWPG
jgi:hypothetical protein